MKLKLLFFNLAIFCSYSAQVVINEVNLIPAPDASAIAVQSLRECTSATAGSEYIELYNNNPCESVDISCYIIGTSGFLNSQTGTFRFPAGTVIPPLGFVSIGGPNSGATFNLFTFCGSPNMASNNNRWYLNNGSHFVMLYDDNGTPVDAVYWANNAADWGTASTISNPPTPVAAGIGCPSVTSLTGPNGIPIGNPIVHYAGSQPSLGQVIHRVPDGSATWQNNGVPSINSCNAACNVANTFQLNATVLDPSCGADDGSISFAPTPAGAYTYDWNPSVSTSASATGLSAGTYQVEISDGSCTIDTTIILQEVQLFSVSASVTQPSCGASDGSIDLNVSPAGAYTFTWNPNVSVTNTAVGLDAGAYQIEISDGNCDWDTTIILISPDAPELSLVISNDISCNGLNDGEVEIAISGGTGPFSWSSVPAGITGPISDNLAAGNYLVTVEDFNGCEGVLNVVINEPDAIVLTTSSQAAECGEDNGEAAVSVSGGVGPYTYLWLPGNQTTPSIINIGSGTYTVTVTDENGCSETATVNVATTDGPNVSIDFVNHESCFGENDGGAGISISGGELPYTILWSPAGGSGTEASNLAPGGYTVLVTDNAGCETTITITINPATQINIDAAIVNADCAEDNGSITLAVSGGNNPYNYLWTPNIGTGPAINGLAAGTYQVLITDNSGCEANAAYIVEQNLGFDVEIIPQNPIIELGETVQLNLVVQPGITPETYIWSPSTGLSCSDCPDPIANPSSTTTYFVTIVDENGCVGQDSVVVFVSSPCTDVMLPSMFSPNGDGNNDVLCILGNCILSSKLTIYNRWGEVVFESVNSADCWDGTHRNKPVNTGAFVYKLEAVLSNGEEVFESGSVTLIR